MITTIRAVHFSIGEQRYTSAGNVFQLIRFADGQNVTVRRIASTGNITHLRDVGTIPLEADAASWDADILYRWNNSQWESLPLLGEPSEEPSFGLFIP